MAEQDVAIETLFEIGPLSITVTVTTTWLIMGLVWLVAWLISRNLRNEPGPLQAAIEGVVLAIEQAVSEVTPRNTRHILPFIGSLWIFLVIANLKPAKLMGVESRGMLLAATVNGDPFLLTVDEPVPNGSAVT